MPKGSAAFEFATAARIRFGRGRAVSVPAEAAQMASRVLLVCGRAEGRGRWLEDALDAEGLEVGVFRVGGEPTVNLVWRGVDVARAMNAELVIGLGGGSVIDTAKAIAALKTNSGSAFDYLEVIGAGRPLERDPLPCIALPTTAGTGSEVTRNAVLRSEEHRVKVSLRHALMLPRLAVVDPELTRGMPRAVAVGTGLDALTQLIEPFVSRFANPLTDGFCREGLPRVARSIVAAMDENDDRARDDMALGSLLGGLALANAGLGAVHGFAGPIGGLFTAAPHGAVCGRLLPFVMEANVRAQRETADPRIDRFAEVARLLTGRSDAAPEDGVAWVAALCRTLDVPELAAYGLATGDFDVLVKRALEASSMKGNPVALGQERLTAVLAAAL